MLIAALNSFAFSWLIFLLLLCLIKSYYICAKLGQKEYLTPKWGTHLLIFPLKRLPAQCHRGRPSPLHSCEYCSYHKQLMKVN